MQKYFWKCAGAYIIGWWLAQIVQEFKVSPVVRTLIFFGGVATIWLLLRISEWYKAKKKRAK